MKLVHVTILLLALFLFSCGQNVEEAPVTDDPNGCCDANESCCDVNETNELNSSTDGNQFAP